jgi:murein DD-endopeptidase MepM/ murein hydrolase activator NlpD
VEPGTLRHRQPEARPVESVLTPGAVPPAAVLPAAVLSAADPAAALAPAEQAASSRRRRPRLRSVRSVGVLAVAVSLVVVVSVAAMPLLFAGQPAVAADPEADPVSPLPAVGTYVLPTPTPTPGRSAVPFGDTVFVVYQVAAGDNLTRIARDFGLSVTTVFWANSPALSNPDLVKIGQKLLIPPVDGVVVRASGSDTVDSIADDNEIDPQVILDANLLSGQNLDDGQLLILPGVPNKPLPHPIAAPPKPEDWLNKLEWPVPNHHTITLKFGCTTFYLEPPFGNCKHYHNGLDIGGARIGTPVVAAASGTVIYAGRKKAGADGAGGGIVVWISHKGTLYTTYNHLNSVTVKVGQHVDAGQQVGTVGNSGAAAGAHLHFEVWTDYPWTGKKMTDAVDPLLYTAWKPGS